MCFGRSRRGARCRRQGEIVPNGVAGAQPNPLGNGTVLLLGLGQLLLDTERLVALLIIALISLWLR